MIIGVTQYRISFFRVIMEPEEVKRCDILVFSGGEDISPRIYGEENRFCSWVDPRRDRYEIDCFNQAVAARIPCIGICRGHQLIAALRGGKLYQDIGVETGQFETNRHGLELRNRDAAPELTEAFARRKVVNSLHHQAVKVIPQDGIELAVSTASGLNEAVYYPPTPEYPPMVGVQWHPELMDDMKLIFFLAIYLRNQEREVFRGVY